MSWGQTATTVRGKNSRLNSWEKQGSARGSNPTTAEGEPPARLRMLRGPRDHRRLESIVGDPHSVGAKAWSAGSPLT